MVCLYIFREIGQTMRKKKVRNHMASEKADLMQEKRDDLLEFGGGELQGQDKSIHCLTIIGQIEGHQVLPENTKSTKYEHVIPQIAAIEESRDIDGLLILLNTVGGDIEAGLAIAELIAGMKKPTVSLVLGGGHSIGVPLAVCAKKSLIVPTASMTIHPVRISGTVIGAPQTYNYFQRIQDQIVEFVCKNSRVKEQEFLDLMMKKDELASDVGSVVYGQQAVEMGLIDRLGGLADALKCLHQMIDRQK